MYNAGIVQFVDKYGSCYLQGENEWMNQRIRVIFRVLGNEIMFQEKR
jgi:hypothetical protein